MSNNFEQQNNDPPRTDEQIQLRRVFIKKVYLLSASFAVAALVQCVILVVPMREYAHFMGYIGLCLLVSSAVSHICIPDILETSPANWIYVGVIVEGFTFVMLFCAEIEPAQFCVIVTINIIVMAVIVVIASKKPCDMTKRGVCLNVFGIFILVSFVGILFIVFVNFFLIGFCVVLIVVLVILLMMYYIQLILGECYNKMELNQVPLAALLQFCSFMVQNLWMMSLGMLNQPK